MKIKALIGVFVAIVSVAGLSLSTVNAQDTGNGFRISPVRIEQTIEKGDSSDVELSVENPTNYPINAKIIANDFEVADDESGQPKVIFEVDEQAPGNSFKSLVGDLGNVDIPANGTAKINVKVSVPENASAGGYYGTVRVEPSDQSDSNLNLSASVGTIFLITVPGDLTEQLELVELTAAKSDSTGRFFVGNGSGMQIVTRLQNSGNIHVKPFGRVQITNSKGEVVEQFEFNDTEPRSNVLPNSIRKFTNNLEYNKFFGKYTVTANLGYGNGNGLITAKNTFWVIPIWLLVVVVVALVAILIGAFLIYRKISQSRKHKVKPRR